MQNSVTTRTVPTVLFAATIFLSAFLLFEVQPMVAKIILPWFGGSAAVWTACLLFFQLVLLAGYIYADLSTRLLQPRAQGVLHIVLLVAALLTLPLHPSLSLISKGEGNPEWRIALVLGASVGLPYFLLSTTGPLVQAWYARAHRQALPYRLYALSNLGSMLALLSYPFWVEPQFVLGAQTDGWSWGFVGFAVLCGILAVANLKSVAEASTATPEAAPAAPAKSLYLLWMALAACPSMLLLAVTNHLTANIAPIPFLWILPLVLYLLTFILCFEGRGWYRRGLLVLLLAISIALVCVAILTGPSHPSIARLICLYSSMLFFACMVCHGELAALKPHPKYLTSFYLMLSLGGALGGAMVALIAPHLFRDNYELPLGMVAVIVMVLIIFFRDPASPMHSGNRKKATLMIAVALAAAVAYLWLSHNAWVTARVQSLWEQMPFSLPQAFARQGWLLCLGLCIAIAAMLAMVYQRVRSRSWISQAGAFTALSLAVLLSVTVILGNSYAESAEDARVMLRNFYGWLKVADSGSGIYEERKLTHGTITHGMQFLYPDRKRWPTTYYGRNSGAGLAVTELQRTDYVRVGVVGLGTGTFAAYGRKGDTFRFYDINPQVLALATSEFTYLQDSGANVEIALGDARLSLAGEPSQKFDLLVLDAFSSDSIPVHLLTGEAFAIYFRHLSPRGVLAVHISNRYLDLKPVVREAARFYGKQARLVDSEEMDYVGVYTSDWILVAQDPAIFAGDSLKLSAVKFETEPIRMWTDDFSDLYQILK